MTEQTTDSSATPEPRNADAGAPPSAEGPEAAGERFSALENDLAAAKQEVLYAQAETQNVRRRLEREVRDAHAYAATRFARDILSVADNLQRALESIPATLREHETLKPLLAGIEATARELDSVFQRHGVVRFSALGETLDPNRHQAMLEIPSDQPAGTVLQELAGGYMIGDRLLRPAMVGVAKTAEAKTAE